MSVVSFKNIASLGFTVQGFHSLASGFLLGTTIWHSFISGPITFKTVPRQTFGAIQARLFPVYFGLQTALSAALLGSWLYLRPGLTRPSLVSGLSRTDTWDGINAWFLVAQILTSGLNAFVVGPYTSAIMKDRHKLERQEGKAKEGAPPSPAIKAISKKFGIAHGVSSLLNLFFLLANFSHQAFLGRGI